MTTDMNLKEIERKAWTSFFQDGLLDILMGLALLAVGIPAVLPNIFTSELHQNAAAAVLMVLAFVPYWAGKRFITAPRMGRARFSRARKSKQTKAAVTYAISVVVGLMPALPILKSETILFSGSREEMQSATTWTWYPRFKRSTAV